MIHTFYIKRWCIFCFFKARNLTKSIHVPLGPTLKLRILFTFAHRTSFSGVYGEDRFNFLPLDWAPGFPQAFLGSRMIAVKICVALPGFLSVLPRATIQVLVAVQKCSFHRFDHDQVISSNQVQFHDFPVRERWAKFQSLSFLAGWEDCLIAGQTHQVL